MVYKGSELLKLILSHYREERVFPKFQLMLVAAKNYEVFREAACKGHLEVLKYLAEKAPEKLGEMIAAKRYEAFREAAAEGHLEVLKYLEEKTSPETLRKMIAASNYDAFIWAAAEGYLEVLKYLEEKTSPETLGEMMTVDNYGAFRRAAFNGHLEILKYLEKKAPEMLGEMIAAKGYEAFRRAAAGGHLEALKYLEEKSPGKLGEMIAANNYEAFRMAALNGHFEVLKYLAEKAPGKLDEMIAVGNYEAFRTTARNGYLEIVKYLEEKTSPEMLGEMIAAKNYEAFRGAAINDHLEILKYLEEKTSPEMFGQMIAANNYEAFRWAALSDHFNVVHNFLHHHSALAHAEAHDVEYGEWFVHPFINEKLQALKEQKVQQEAEHSNLVFDLQTIDEAKFYFYMLRNLIRRNHSDLHDDIVFLLEIPAVKNLAHRDAAQEHDDGNELLRLAMSQNNATAIRTLLAIPAVRELAERNNYYQNEQRNEQRDGVNLRNLVQDHESSMTVLTQGEQRRLQTLINRYEPELKKSGVDAIMLSLCETLEKRYREKPAIITVQENGNDKVIALPLTMSNFQKVELNPEQTQQALETYYKHPDHAAWRYLSRPNFWMHPRAEYVYVNADDASERWSTFEEYQPLISLLFLAAKDDKIQGAEFSPEERLTHFINELFYIGRAHNWDRSRINEETGQWEEYDDMEGDRPSCYSGVKRRLFQSVLGHPDLNILTSDKLKAENRNFVVQHWRDVINKDNKEAIGQVWWDKIVLGDDLEEHDWEILKMLDIPKEKQQSFIAFLEEKYGEQFTQNAAFQAQIISDFQLNDNEPDAHILRFGYFHPEQFFALPECSANSVANGRYGFFASSPMDEEAEEQENDIIAHP